MRNTIATTLLLTATLLLPTFLVGAPDKPTEVNPIEVGSTVPDVTLTQADGNSVQLRELVAEKDTVIVFYRGSWCPYCTRHLAALGQVENQLLEKGYQIVAVSPDNTKHVSESASDYNYTLYSDSEMKAASAFGLAFEVDARMRKKLESYNIDIETASSQKHHLLPVPAVYIVGKDGLIKFRHFNPDYKKRLDPEDILEAIQ
ncbi:MAG: peroxiredoxin-like family protein [Opitutaceae bacterium]